MRAGMVLSIGASLVIISVGAAGIARADAGGGAAAKTPPVSQALSPQQLEATAEKRQAEAQFLSGAAAPLGPRFGVIVDGRAVGTNLVSVPESVCGSACGGGGYPASAYFPGNQTAQITSYYCGPATVHEALGAMGVGMSQDTAASHLGTTTNGTPWSGGITSPTGYPVPDVMNHHETRNNYVPQYVSSNGSSAVNQYEQDLVFDIYGFGAPVIGDAYEVPGGPHLVGHPSSAQILHWFDIRGYASSGASTMYEDSVHGAGSIGWSGGVPAYSTMSSSTIVTIVWGRGYVW